MEALISMLVQLPVVQQVLALPWLVQVFLYIGVARSIFKPLMSFAHSVVAATPSTKDDEALEKVEASKAFKAVAWVFDYLFSLKLIK